MRRRLATVKLELPRRPLHGKRVKGEHHVLKRQIQTRDVPRVLSMAKLHVVMVQNLNPYTSAIDQMDQQ
ncbi:hypothetical protein BHE74_00056896 [Ensete ventricosum]|nr:hypothetical protein BHE74_00056896 [Ensete ventricosum]